MLVSTELSITPKPTSRKASKKTVCFINKLATKPTASYPTTSKAVTSV